MPGLDARAFKVFGCTVAGHYNGRDWGYREMTREIPNKSLQKFNRLFHKFLSYSGPERTGTHNARGFDFDSHRWVSRNRFAILICAKI